MVSKKKKEVDFKKVKLKVGRKVVKSLNETKTDFKARKLILKEAKTLGKDPINALLTCSDANTQLKLLCLSKVSEGCLSVNPKLITGDVAATLSRLLLDTDTRVRKEARNCIRQSINSLEKAKMDLEPLFRVLLNYLKCGVTHIDRAISSDSRFLLNTIIEKANAGLHTQLMNVIITRFSEGNRHDSTDFDLALSLLERMKSAEVKSSTALEMKWNPANCHADLARLVFKPSLQYDISFKSKPFEDASLDITDTLKSVVSKELRHLLVENNENTVFTVDEAKQFISVAKICRLLKCPKLMVSLHNGVSVVGESASRSSTKGIRSPAHLAEEINKLLPSVCAV